MKFKLLNEAYTTDVINSYLQDVYNAYDRLRDCLYALDNAVDGIDNLENSINMILINMEDDFWPYTRDHLNDVEDYLNPQEEEIEEDLNNSESGKWDNDKFIPTTYKDGRICLPKEFWEDWD